MQSEDSASIPIEGVTFLVALADDRTGRVGKVAAGEQVATLAAGAVDAAPIEAGEGILLAGGNFRATSPGNLRLSGRTLKVTPLLEIDPANLAPARPICFEGDALVYGSLGDGSRLRTGGSLFVQGSADGARVNVEACMHVAGPIIGNGKDWCVVERDLACERIDSARIIVRGDVQVAGDVVGAQLITAGSLAAKNIVGGKLMINGGATCDTLGDAQQTATILEVATAQTRAMLLAAALAECDAADEKVKAIRRNIEPLFQNTQDFSPIERERATELAHEAEELLERTMRKRGRLSELRAQIDRAARPELHVRGMLHPGVTLRLDGRELVVSLPLRGPMTLFVSEGEMRMREAGGGQSVLQTRAAREGAVAVRAVA